jgi:hypothetical protein
MSKCDDKARQFAIALFESIYQTGVQSRAVGLDALVDMLTSFEVLARKRQGRCWSPTLYAANSTSRSNAGVRAISCLVFDLDGTPPNHERLAFVYWIAHTTWSNTEATPRWRVVLPLAAPVAASQWSDVWWRARATVCPDADKSCKDPSRVYLLPHHPAGAPFEAMRHVGPLLETASLPPVPMDPLRIQAIPWLESARSSDNSNADRRRADAYMARVVSVLESVPPGGRNDALNRAAWALGRWVAAGALDRPRVEDLLFSAAAQNGLAADDGQRQVCATIRSGLNAGLRQPIDFQATYARRHGDQGANHGAAA